MREFERIDAKMMKGSNIHVNSLLRAHFESKKRSRGRHRPSL